ncbi:hypothetical protein TWF481_001754 [Arthrobotrys musiformis]|uniref:Nucleoside phosphorylase domain-containing protein n=1 Tax=Arthrobotrys musiformis TaxID=47236 RepID=A0AAV9VW10_9PEZI
MTTETLRREDYTVGWICALKEEMVAAKIMLDKIHQKLPQLPNDTNSYILGSIGEHNIVIACLPEAGTNQAGKVATWMVSSFSNVKVGLMVGIGGGVPGKVRLGDVVVSTPTDRYPGVVQYDYGKVEGKGFRRTGALNKPPTALLTALKSLQAEHDISGFELQESLDRLGKLYPKLGKSYKQRPSPGPQLDGDEGGEETEIHYGLIISGNMVIKDAKYRDELDESLDGKVLCIEMEAAGLMDDFPCMVIRGICDYADSRKNDDWHHYAATVAAAFARDFLGHIRPVDVHRETPIRDILLRQGHTIETIHNDTKEVKSMLEDEDVLKFLESMTPIKHTAQHSIISQSRQTGSGQWLINLPQYQTWLKNPKRLLHCRGIPKAGKTFLTSRVIDHLFSLCSADSTSAPGLFGKEANVGIAYIYCDYTRDREQTTFNMLASLLVQLVRHRNFTGGRGFQSSLFETVKVLYEEYRQSGRQPSIDGVKRALRSAVEIYSRVFIIIDAIDECKTFNSCRQDLLRNIFDLHDQCGISVFSTSRDMQDVINRFKSQGAEIVNIRAHEDDLRAYLRYQIAQSHRKLLQGHTSLVEAKIIKAVDGMFPFVQLFFQSIENKTSLKQLKDALEDLTGGTVAYRTAYESIMDRINAQHPDLKRLSDQVLEWVVCAQRPLKILELQHALVVMSKILARPQANFYSFPGVDSDDLPEVDSMLSACTGLVESDADTGTIRLTHATAREYFRQNFSLTKTHSNIAEVCITYLSCKYQRSERRGYSVPRELDDYILTNWGHHVRGSNGRFADMAYTLLKKRELLETYCKDTIILTKPTGDTIWSGVMRVAVAGLAIAAHFGLEECVKRFLADKPLPCSPIIWAAKSGFVNVVNLLLNDSTVQDLSTATRWAALEGHIHVVDALLTRKDFQLEEILSLAARGKTTSFVQRLLLAGANPDGKHDTRSRARPPLLVACEHGSPAVVELLLKAGADPDMSPVASFGPDAPLLKAIGTGSARMVELLIDYGANIEIKNFAGKTLREIAVERGHMDIVKLLDEAKTRKPPAKEAAPVTGETKSPRAYRGGPPMFEREGDIRPVSTSINCSLPRSGFGPIYSVVEESPAASHWSSGWTY